MVELVLFDLGGVLADFGGVGPMRELAGIDTDEEVWRRWLACPWVRAFERGACGADEFAAGLVSEWGLSISPEQFLAGFRSWLAAPLPGAEELVRSVRDRMPVGCLSNTNQVHWDEAVVDWPLVDLFDHRFLSFQIGLLKPDADVFQHVAKAVALEPSRVLFLDDNLINVEGARHAGFAAAHVRGVHDARASLVEYGVL